MPQLIRIPWQFYLDHFERSLPTPEEVKSTKRHLWIRADDPFLESLRADAEFYADQFGPDAPWLKASAQATVKAINKALAPVDNIG